MNVVETKKNKNNLKIGVRDLPARNHGLLNNMYILFTPNGKAKTIVVYRRRKRKEKIVYFVHF